MSEDTPDTPEKWTEEVIDGTYPKPRKRYVYRHEDGISKVGVRHFSGPAAVDHGSVGWHVTHGDSLMYGERQCYEDDKQAALDRAEELMEENPDGFIGQTIAGVTIMPPITDTLQDRIQDAEAEITRIQELQEKDGIPEEAAEALDEAEHAMNKAAAKLEGKLSEVRRKVCNRE